MNATDDIRRLLGEVLHMIDDLQNGPQQDDAPVWMHDSLAKQHSEIKSRYLTDGLSAPGDQDSEDYSDDFRLSTICSRYFFSDPSLDVTHIDWAKINGLRNPGGDGDTSVVTVSSGGQVFVVEVDGALCILKFTKVRGESYAELLAADLGRFLGVRVPAMRLIHSSTEEWTVLRDAIQSLKSDDTLASSAIALMECCHCCLIAEFVAGDGLGTLWGTTDTAFFEDHHCISQIGRLLVLDMVTRNPDRLPCATLGWKGNLSNIRVDTDQLTVVAIDSGIPHLPARLREKFGKDDKAAISQLLTKLRTSSIDIATELFGGATNTADYATIGTHLLEGVTGAAAEVKALLPILKEVWQVLHDTVADFLATIQAPDGQENYNPKFGVTRQVKHFQKVRRASDDLNLSTSPLMEWNEQFAMAGEEVRRILQDKGMAIRTGFLDEEVALPHMLGNGYEMKVRLDVVIDRMKWVADAFP